MKIFGKNPVIERLRVNPKSVNKIYLEEGFTGSAIIRKKAKPWGIPIFVVPRSKMAKVGRSINTQGVILIVEGFEYVPFEELLERAIKKRRCVVFLDEVSDPQNLGAMIRSLACLGKFSLVLPSHKSVKVTEAVLRVASGGDNYVPVAQVSNLRRAIETARNDGFTVAGAVVNKGVQLFDVEFTAPLALVVGSEQKGIRDVTRKLLDIEFNIPMGADTMSFNVAHATAIIGYEIARQRHYVQKDA